MSKIELIKQKIKENEEQLNKDQHILSYTSLIAINHQLRDELVDELESEIGSLIMTNGILKEVLDNQEHIENENLMLKTKISMYQELVKTKDLLFKNQDDMLFSIKMKKEMSKELDEKLYNLKLKSFELEKQIASLNKKCDGECEI